MTLSLEDIGAPAEMLGGWSLPARARFVPSQAYDILSRDLLRYAREEISGRSFLLSGHRGSGKTALVTQAVHDLSHAIIRDSLRIDGSSKPGGALGLQRPLFVKLHGPSLLASTLPGPGPRSSDAGGGTAAAAEAVDKTPPGERPSSRSHLALVQLTIALYRALASEVAMGFAAHAREIYVRSSGVADYRELAAQLALELDSGAEPAVLRGYWDALSRLPGRRGGSGILWPRHADETLSQLGILDQGFREIIAVATAAQAYRKCVGREAETLSSSEDFKRESASSAGANLGEILNRIGALLAGSVAGGLTASQGAAPALGAGVLVWLLGGVALNWTSTRSRKRVRSSSYTYIPDRSEATLERDLPGVIRRIQDAGLAPVFVLDELDKLPDPRSTIKEIINGLKHLVTDHGFFCFLTDRDYFDLIQRTSEIEVYPTEHTYYSERLLMLYGAEDLLAYLMDAIKGDQAGDRQEDLARVILSLKIIQRAKLNFADLVRDLSSYVGPRGKLRVTAADILMDVRIYYRLAASMQLAIDAVMRAPPLANRLDSEPAFTQLAVDALYMISRCWEEERPTVDLGRQAIRDYLERRMRLDPTSIKSPAGQPALAEADLDFLKEQIEALARYLEDWTELRQAVAQRQDMERFGIRPDAILPTSYTRGLIEKADADHWAFLCDVTGRILQPPSGAGGQAAPRGEADADLLKLTDALRSVIEACGVGVDALVQVGLLPPTISDSILDAAQSVLSDPGATEENRQAAAARLRELKGVLIRHGKRVGQALLLVDYLRDMANLKITEAPLVLGRISRHVALADDSADYNPPLSEVLAVLDLHPAPRLRLGGSDRSIRRWLTEFRRFRSSYGSVARPSLKDPRLGARSWAEWRTRVLDHISGSSSGLLTLGLGSLIYAARDVAPSAWFRSDLDQMGVGDWSGIALRAIGSSERVPLWPALAALRELGFGRPALLLVRDRYLSRAPPKWAQTSDDAAALERIMESAASTTPAALLYVADRGAGILAQPPGRRPVLGLDSHSYPAFQAEIGTLAAMGLFGALIHELPQNGQVAEVAVPPGLKRISTCREASPGTNGSRVDVLGVDTLEKLIDAYELRGRELAGKEWRSNADAAPSAA